MAQGKGKLDEASYLDTFIVDLISQNLVFL